MGLKNIKNEINLLVNVDGLSLYKSAKSCFWPILCSDTELKDVFIVGLYQGNGKPHDSNDFLKAIG